MSSAPQPGVQPVDLAQNLLQSNPSADALVRQLAQMQVQNQQVNYQQQVWPSLPPHFLLRAPRIELQPWRLKLQNCEAIEVVSE